MRRAEAQEKRDANAQRRVVSAQNDIKEKQRPLSSAMRQTRVRVRGMRRVDARARCDARCAPLAARLFRPPHAVSPDAPCRYAAAPFLARFREP